VAGGANQYCHPDTARFQRVRRLDHSQRRLARLTEQRPRRHTAHSLDEVRAALAGPRRDNMTESPAHYVVDEKGKKTGVLLTLRQYQKLLEDLHDLAVVAERREEEPVSLNVLKR